MTRALLLASAAVALLGVSACSPGYSDEGYGPRETAKQKAAAAAKARIDPARVISGEVLAPEGQTLDGAKVMACLTPRETCAKEAEAVVKVEDGVGRYDLVLPAAGDYHLTVWKDVDGDGAPDAGDLLAFANNMEPVASGQRLTPMTAFVRGEGEMVTNPGGRPMGAASDLEASARAVKAAGLGGRWSQSSTGTELVWGPEIKFQAANATVGFGTNLGGTFGAGSPTNTTIVYSYKPVQIRRTMSLTVTPDGAFHWVSDQERKQGKCRQLRQEKHGRIEVEGDKLTFFVADARQRCGGGKVETLALKDETYTLVKGGDGFRLTGDKGVNWAFSGG